MSLTATISIWREAKRRNLENKGWEPAELLVLLALADMADDTLHVWRSADSISAVTGYGIRHIRGILSKLIKKGDLEKAGRHGAAGITIYKIQGAPRFTPDKKLECTVIHAVGESQFTATMNPGAPKQLITTYLTYEDIAKMTADHNPSCTCENCRDRRKLAWRKETIERKQKNSAF